MKPLGKTQQAMLDALKRHGGWSTYRCGWLWNTPSYTIKLCESLVARGLVVKTETPDRGTLYEITASED